LNYAAQKKLVLGSPITATFVLQISITATTPNGAAKHFAMPLPKTSAPKWDTNPRIQVSLPMYIQPTRCLY